MGSGATGGTRPTQSRQGRIVIVSGSVGAGHDGVAYELASRLAASGHHVDVVDMLEGFPAAVRIGLGSAYVAILRWLPWLYSLVYLAVERSRVIQFLAGRACATAIPWLTAVTRDADLVVATYPPASRALGQMRTTGRLSVPVVTFLTDPAPNYMWMHSGVDTYLCTGEQTVAEARMRYDTEAIDVGPVVSRRYHVPTDASLAKVCGLASLGLPAGSRYALVLLGSLGVGDMRAAVSALCDAGIIPVVLCGRNARLRRSLMRREQCLALGWREDVPILLAGATLVVHNAGGLSLSESIVTGVPAVTFAPIPGHGRDNARVLHAHGVAPWAKSSRSLTSEAGRVASKPPSRAAVPVRSAEQVISELAEQWWRATPRREQRGANSG